MGLLSKLKNGGYIMDRNESKIEANKVAWGKLAEDHYKHFKALLSREEFKLNPILQNVS